VNEVQRSLDERLTSGAGRHHSSELRGGHGGGEVDTMHDALRRIAREVEKLGCIFPSLSLISFIFDPGRF